jgi:hypothetical protein
VDPLCGVPLLAPSAPIVGKPLVDSGLVGVQLGGEDPFCRRGGAEVVHLQVLPYGLHIVTGGPGYLGQPVSLPGPLSDIIDLGHVEQDSFLLYLGFIAKAKVRGGGTVFLQLSRFFPGIPLAHSREFYLLISGNFSVRKTPDAMVEVRGNRYSVPSYLIRERVQVRIGLDGVLRIHFRDMLVAMHLMRPLASGWATCPAHHKELWQEALSVERRPLSVYEEVLT